MNNENLINIVDRSESERREICSKGGKASGVARRRKKLLSESVTEALERKAKDIPALKKIIVANGLDPETDLQAVLCQTILLNMLENKNANARDFLNLAEFLGETNTSGTAEEQKQDNLLKAIEKAVKSTEKKGGDGD